ncbi:MAG: hypothetical protein J5980_06885, partial [Muribaculaceae bacterium]|nr:hypothetical protein [Muribaculaceae bacterium]
VLSQSYLIMLGPLVNGIACFGKPLDMSPFASVKHTVVQGGNVLHGAMLGLLYGAAEKAELQ